MAAVAVLFLWHISRFSGYEPIASALFPVFLLCLVATPLLVLWGLGFSLYLCCLERAAREDGKAKPSPFVFAVCGLLWLAQLFIFRLVPFFAGESRTQRFFVDGWLDRLL